jgi:hypothetical protein
MSRGRRTQSTCVADYLENVRFSSEDSLGRVDPLCICSNVKDSKKEKKITAPAAVSVSVSTPFYTCSELLTLDRALVPLFRLGSMPK